MIAVGRGAPNPERLKPSRLALRRMDGSELWFVPTCRSGDPMSETRNLAAILDAE
jgi:hypothetical protein